jgi:hypothetical protein
VVCLALVARRSVRDLTDELSAEAVAAALAAEPIGLALAMRPEREGGLPARPGFYAWWIEREVIGGVPYHPHPARSEFGLLYIGISPKRPGSSGLIRSRVIEQHVRGNTSSSTFRFVLASMLLDQLQLKPRATTKKVVLDKVDNDRLREWQFEHLWVTWCERERPWEVEDEAIALMQPPLNAAANQAHPFYATVTSARAAFRAAAATR